ncbi:MAG: hypothetical protein WD805_02685 [Gaiellaceae bacterium]
MPVGLYGKRLRLLGVELCYHATSVPVEIDAVQLRVRTHDVNAAGVVANEVVDETTRDDEACRVYAFTTPPTLTHEQSVMLLVRLDFGAAAQFRIARTTFVLEPTSENATAPS